MRAAVLERIGDVPRAGEFQDPVAGPRQLALDVLAAGINHLDLAKAAGRFYGETPPLPVVAGTDGVGRDADGRRWFFDDTVAPYGALGERTLVGADSVVPVPDGVADDVAAALGNAGTAASTALRWRGRLAPGERVLVLGATGAVGHVAVQLAKLLGADRVVAVGRGAEQLGRLRELGADAALDLDEQPDPLAALTDAGGPFDLIVDLLWGEPVLTAIRCAAFGGRLVQLGQLAGADIVLPSALLRSRMLTVHGVSGVMIAPDVRADAYREVAAHAASGRLIVDLERVALSDVEAAWARQATNPGTKIVVIP